MRPGLPRPWTECRRALERIGARETNALAPLFDAVFVVNLSSRSDKRTYQQAQLEAHGIGAHLYPAVNGAEVVPADVPDTDMRAPALRLGLERNPGGVGHLLTFLELFRLTAEPDNRLDRILILEDDVDLRSDFIAELGLACAEVPGDWDLLLLGFFPWWQSGVLWPWRAGEPIEQLTPRVGIPAGGSGSFAWAVSRGGARRVLDELLPLDEPWDYRQYRAFLEQQMERVPPEDPWASDPRRWMYPTPAAFDLRVNLIFDRLNVFYLTDGRQRPVVPEPIARFGSDIQDMGRRC